MSNEEQEKAIEAKRKLLEEKRQQVVEDAERLKNQMASDHRVSRERAEQQWAHEKFLLELKIDLVREEIETERLKQSLLQQQLEKEKLLTAKADQVAIYNVDQRRG